MLGVYLVILCLGGLFITLRMWTAVEEAARTPAPGEGEAIAEITANLWLFSLTGSPSVVVLVFVGVMGVIGAAVRGLRAVAHHMAWRKFSASWAWWYITRPVVGAALAVIFYLLLAAGLIGLAGEGDQLNPWGAGAIGAFTGLFSANAVTLLSDIAKTALGHSDRGDQPGADPDSQDTRSGEPETPRPGDSGS